MFTLNSRHPQCEYPLEEGVTNIGSDSTNDLCLNHPSVLAFHAVIIVERDQVLIQNLGGAANVSINGNRIESGFLTPGQHLTLGEVNLELSLQEANGQDKEDIVVRIPDRQPPNNPAPASAPVSASSSWDAPPQPADGVQIIIPPMPQKTDTPTLSDGTHACRKHILTAATVRCIACNRMYCGECVRPIGLQGGKKRMFCPHCSQPCVYIYSKDTKQEKRTTFRSIVAWLQHFLRRR